MGRELLILDGQLPPRAVAGSEHLDMQAFVQKAYAGHWWGRLQSYEHVRLLTAHPQCLPRRLLMLALLRLLAKGPCEVQGANGQVVPVTWLSLLKGMGSLARDALGQHLLCRAAERRLEELESLVRRRGTPRRLRMDKGVLYLKTDLWLGVPAGGSVTHMAGVANELARYWGPLKAWAAAPNPLLVPAVEMERLDPPSRFWDFREAPLLAFNEAVLGVCETALSESFPGWIYQRYSLHNFAGAWAAEHAGFPLVLEYNGSEVWMGKHWGSGLRWPALAERTERINLAAADLIVVVSEASRAELVERGVDPGKVLVNPNGVDTEQYSPQVLGDQVRNRLGWAGKTVIGFIGTFGPWHGAEVLVEAFAQLCARQAGNEALRLLLVGDGPTRFRCEQLAGKLGVADRVVFPGMVAQAEGPAWLAACDVLVAPHVPNEDGSVFFGSPTKLFEYMAMQRPIVASRLGQMEEVLEHGQTGWLVEPGQAQALADGLELLVNDMELQERMARNARQTVVQKYTWRAHTARIVEKLQSLCN